MTLLISDLEKSIDYENSCGNFDKSLSLIEKQESIFFQIKKFQTLKLAERNADEVLIEIINQLVEKNILNKIEVLCLAYAKKNLKILHWEPRFEKIVPHEKLVQIFHPHPVPSFLISPIKRPPRPTSQAPPRKPALQHQPKEPRRALPGYTPGWMAQEYAKKL